MFVVIVGTGNHYILDCLVGTSTFLFAAAVATVLHTPGKARTAVAPAARVFGASFAFMMIAWGLVSLQLIEPKGWSNVVPALVLVRGIVAVLARASARRSLWARPH